MANTVGKNRLWPAIIYRPETRFGYMHKSHRKAVDKVLTFITKAARTVNIADKFRKDIKFTIGRIKSAKRRPAKRKPAKRKPAKRKHIPKAVRDAVMERDNYKCVYCASTNNPELDHDEARANGGSDDDDNLQVLCRSCNRRKGVS